MQYQQLMTSSHIVAGVFNGQRTKRSDKYFTFMDFHPDHHEAERGISGNELNRRITSQMEATGEVEWLDED